MSLAHKVTAACFSLICGMLFLAAPAIAEGPGARDEIAELNARATLLREKSRWLEAMPVAERLANLIVQRDGENSTNAADAIHWWAWLVQENGDYKKAEQLWLRALGIDEHLFGKDSLGTTRRLHLLANCYRDQGHYRKAQPYLQKALAIREKHLGRDHPETAQIVNSLGVLDQKMGDFAGAEANFLRALSVFERPEVHGARNVAGLLSALGWLYVSIGDLQRSRDFVERSLECRKKLYGVEHVYTANALAELAMLERVAGRLEKARHLYMESLGIRERLLGTNHLSVAEVLGSLAAMCAGEGDLESAQPYARRARAIIENNLGVDHPRLGSLLLQQATMEEMKGDYATARELCQRAYEITGRHLGLKHRTTLSCLRRLAWLDVAEGRFEQAMATADRLQQGEEDLLHSFFSFTSERQRLAAQRDAAVFRNRYDLWASIGAVKPLARAIIRTKGVVLDSLIEDRMLAEEAADPELREMVGQLSRVRRGHPRRIEPVSHQTAEVLRSPEVEELQASLARRVSGIGPARRALSAKLDGIIAAIPKDTVVLEIIKYSHRDGKFKEERFGALVLSHGSEPKWVTVGPAAAIERSVKLYQHAVRTRHTTELGGLLRHLYDCFRPLLSQLPDSTRRLIISPDGELNFLSFATLLSPNGRFLGEEYLLSYVSCARDLLAQGNPGSAGPQLAVWANPDFGVNASPDRDGLAFPPLPGAGAEGRRLYCSASQLGFTNAVLFLGADATEARLQSLSSPGVLHLATHGFILPRVPESAENDDYADMTQNAGFRKGDMHAPTPPNPMLRAGLALAGARRTIDRRARGELVPGDNDGLLTADEIATLNLRGTKLVVLSACNTGAGEARSGEGVLGLRRGFVQAGAESLVLTLWPIDDEQTGGFMPEFYEAMHKGAAPWQALAEVQRKWLERLRRERGPADACRIAGPFMLSFQSSGAAF